jgi:hypothetical protein
MREIKTYYIGAPFYNAFHRTWAWIRPGPYTSRLITCHHNLRA